VNDFRLQLLKLSLRSLRITTGGRKQLILCDNGDARQTEYLKRVKSEKHLIFGENKGITFARNAGAEEATGDYICFVDGDLVYRPFWLSTVI
jgi:glycosyltransferase involved in cell wall biosynthesis